MLNNILITGISSLDCYPKPIVHKCCKQGMLNISLCIPEEKPDIESINEIKLCADTVEYKIINTVLGPKVLTFACLNIKVIYTADNCQQSVHSAHWNTPLCDFTLLKDFSLDKCKSIIKGVFVGIEDACVKYSNVRVIDLSVLYILCPLFCICSNETNSHFCDPDKNKNVCYKRRGDCSRDNCGYKLNIYNT